MATVVGTALTLLDYKTRVDPNGTIGAIAEVLSQTNEVVEDIPWVEGNLPTGHQTSIRTGLPTVYFRQINQGIPPSKSTVSQVTEGTAMMEARGQIDRDLAMLNGNTAAFRASENMPFFESMSQTFVSKLIYGNIGASPEEFTGLSTRYSDDTTALNKENIIDGGGSGSDNTSIWLIGWGEQAVHGIYPKGSQMGLQHEDLGVQDAFDASGNRFRALLDWYQWKCGIVVRDWRYAVRIANIDVSNLVAETSAADILELMAVAVDKIPKNRTSVRLSFYMNSVIRTMLRIQVMNRPNVYLTPGGEESKHNMTFDGIPLKIVDQLLRTEATVN